MLKYVFVELYSVDSSVTVSITLELTVYCVKARLSIFHFASSNVRIEVNAVQGGFSAVWFQAYASLTVINP